MNRIVYRVKLTGITELLGGMPKTKELIDGQMSSKEVRLRAKAAGRDPERLVAENLASMGIEEGLEEILDEEKLANGFRRDEEGFLCLGAHQIPSMLTDAATTLKLSRKIQGLKDLLTRGMTAWQASTKYGERGPLLRIGDADGTPVSVPNGTLEWGSQIRDRMGSRAILRRYDFVHPWMVEFSVRYPDTGVLTQAVWEDLWEMAQDQGLGTARPRGYGRFTAEYERQ